jgi:hypothetical protein
MRSCSPSKYNVSTVSSVRQTIRFGGNMGVLIADQRSAEKYFKPFRSCEY